MQILVKAYGADAVRFYFMAELEFGKDGDFSELRFQEKVRTLTFYTAQESHPHVCPKHLRSDVYTSHGDICWYTMCAHLQRKIIQKNKGDSLGMHSFHVVNSTLGRSCCPFLYFLAKSFCRDTNMFASPVATPHDLLHRSCTHYEISQPMIHWASSLRETMPEVFGRLL